MALRPVLIIGLVQQNRMMRRKREEKGNITEVEECGCARPIDRGAVKSQDRQYTVATKTRTKNLG